MRTRSAATIALAAGLTASAASQGTSPRQFRYDFTIEVTENQVIGSSVAADNPELTALTLGTTGQFSVLATDVEVFPGDGVSAFLRIEDVSLTLGAIALESNPAFYGDSNNLLTSFRLNNNAIQGDDLFIAPVFQSSPLSNPTLYINQPAPGPGQDPTLLESVGLPTMLDLGLSGVTTRFRFFAPPGSPTSSPSVTSEVTDVTITIIPAPATLALLTPAAALLARRRR